MKSIFPIIVSAMVLSMIILTKPDLIANQQMVDVIQVKMTARTMNKGKYTLMNADIWYQNRDGKMVSHYTAPDNLVIITNNKGEAQLYNVEQNTVASQQNQAYSTNGSYFYYFLANKANNLGLDDLGFKLADTKFEGSRVISKWLPPASLLSVLKSVEMVLDNYKPIYMAYYNPKGKIIRKVFYYQYKSMSDIISLPLAVTEINYLDSGDSVLTKTSYSDIKINNEVKDIDYINFIIPANAKKMVD